MSDHVVELPSGLTVAVDTMPWTRSVSIGAWVGVGARDEPREISGVSHFLEHLLFKGTATRTAIEISQAVDRVGGDINAFTAKEYTAYYCRLPMAHTRTGIELLGDVLTAPALRDDDVESERQVILEELAMDDDSPDDVVHRMFARQVFGNHPLGRDTAGERDTVGSISAADIRRFHAEHYRAGGTVVAVAGCVDPDEVVALVESAFADLPAGDGRVARTAPKGMLGDAVVDDDTEQVHLLIGGRSFDRNDPDREALDIANHVLGGGLSSRLFDEIRERRGLVYSVFSGLSAYADSGAWSVYAGTLPEHATTVQDLVLEQLERLADEGITHDELAIAIGSLTGSYVLGLEDSGARMSRLGTMLVTDRLVDIETQLARWSAVTREDVHRVVKRVYGGAAPLTVALGPGYRR
jgi:predicted Zn-dependent peptidase